MAELGPKPKDAHKKKCYMSTNSFLGIVKLMIWTKDGSKYFHLDIKMTALLSFNIIVIILKSLGTEIF